MKFKLSPRLFGFGAILSLIIGYKLGGFFGMMMAFWLLIASFYFLISGALKRIGNFGSGSLFSAQRGSSAVFFQVMGYIHGTTENAETEVALQQMANTLRIKLDVARKDFQQGQSPSFDLQKTLQQLRFNPFFLQIFVDLQVKAAQLSGMDTAKQQRLHELFQQLGYMPLSFYFQQQFQQQQSYRYQYQQQYTHPRTSADALAKAYLTLGVNDQANETDIKRAYRRLMSKHHPDKFAAQGLSEAMLKMATEKAQEIQLAYDLIKKQRGF